MHKPDNGPYAKAPIRAGRSDRSIRANDGDNGTGNSAKASTKLMADKTAIIVIVRTFDKDDLEIIVVLFMCFSFHPDYDRRQRDSTVSALQESLQAFTAGQELHLASKILKSYKVYSFGGLPEKSAITACASFK